MRYIRIISYGRGTLPQLIEKTAVIHLSVYDWGDTGHSVYYYSAATGLANGVKVFWFFTHSFFLSFLSFK